MTIFFFSQLKSSEYIGILKIRCLSKGILFLQDNAAPNKAAITHQKLEDLHLEVFKHLAFSPDFAPPDYYLFPDLFTKPKTCQFHLVLIKTTTFTVAIACLTFWL
jgi:hypothetical protein